MRFSKFVGKGRERCDVTDVAVCQRGPSCATGIAPLVFMDLWRAPVVVLASPSTLAMVGDDV